jgi:hypothetical protein
MASRYDQLARAQAFCDFSARRIGDARFYTAPFRPRFRSDENGYVVSFAKQRFGGNEDGIGALFGVDVQLHRCIDGKH